MLPFDFREYPAKLEEVLKKLPQPLDLGQAQDAMTALCNEMGFGWERGLRKWPGVLYVADIFVPPTVAAPFDTLIIDEQGNVFSWGETPADPERAARYAEIMAAHDAHIAQKRAELAEPPLPMG